MSDEFSGANAVKVAVVGCGLWGRNHVRNHAAIGSLAAVVDRDPERAKALAAEHRVPARTFAEALGDRNIAALVFALPPSQNLPLGQEALAAGKHLFVEKPLAMSVAEGEVLCQAAEAAGRTLMVGHILQYHPAFEALRDLVREGRMGRLLSLVSTRLDLGRIRREEDALWALAPHDLSMILALAGDEPESVTAFGGYHTHETIADRASVELRFSGRLRGEVRVSWLHPFKEQRLVAVGTDAMAVFDDREPWDKKLVLYRHRIVERDGVPIAEKADGEAVTLAPGEPLRRECLHFLRCAATGERPLTDGREGLRVLRALERASGSMRTSFPGG